MATVDRKEHYRLYKSGKQWVVAGAVAVSFALGMLTVETNNAHADTTTAEDNSSTTTDQTAPAQTVTLKNSAASSSASSAAGATSDSQAVSSAASSAASSGSVNTEFSGSSSSAAAETTSSATPSAAVEPASVSTSQASAGSSESATTSSVASVATSGAASSAITATSDAASAGENTASAADLTAAVGLKDATAAMVDGQLVVTAKSSTLSAEDAAAVAAYAQQNQVPSKIVQIDADGDLSTQFGLADGDTATVSGTDLTLNLQDGHYLTYKQINDIADYALKNGLTVKDSTVKVIYTDTLNKDVDLSNNPLNYTIEELQTYTEVRGSDPLTEDSKAWFTTTIGGPAYVKGNELSGTFRYGVSVSHYQRNKASGGDQVVYPDSRFMVILPADQEKFWINLNGNKIVSGTVTTRLSNDQYVYMLSTVESEKVVRAMAYAATNNVPLTFSDSGSSNGTTTDKPFIKNDNFIATGIATVIGPDGQVTTDSETGQGQIIVADPNNLTDTSSDKPAIVNTDVSAVLAKYSDKTKYVITVSSDTTGMLTDPNLTGKATADIGFIDALNGVEPTITYTVKSLATVDNPGTEPGTTAADLAKTVTEVANYGDPVGQSNKQITVNNYYRTAAYTTNTDGTVDPDSIVYSAWVLDDPATTANEGATAVTSTGAAVDGSFAALTDDQLLTPDNYTATVATSGDTTTTDNSAADYSFADNADNSALIVTRNVTYTHNKAIIHFVDEDEGNKELGTFSTDSSLYQYRDGDATDASGNSVSLTNYTFDQSKMAAEGGTYDTGSNGEDIKDPSGDVYVELQHKTTDESVTVNRTIKYVMSDGSTAPTAVPQTATWTKHTDLVTGESTYTQQSGFDAAKSPDVTGYTPDTKTVPATDVASGTTTTVPTDAADVTVTYSANEQTAEVQYIDDTTGAKLDSDVLNGKTNAAIDFTAVAGKIADFEAKNYELVSDDTKDGATYNATSGDTQTFEVHFKEKVDGPKTPGAGEDGYADTHKDFKVTVTATSPDGSDVTPDNGTQTMHFTRTETTNLVTNVVTYGDWTQAPDDAAFITVTPKAVTNYTATLTNSDGSVDADTQVTDSDFATALTAFAAAKDTAAGAYTANFTYTQTNFTPSNPGNDDQTNEDALTKTVTENVTYGSPVSKTTTVETAKFYRTATKDADGKVTYTAWTTDANGDATKGESSLTIKALTTDQKLVPTGYTLGKETQTDAAGTTTDGDTDMTVDAGTDDADITVSRTVAYTHTYTPTDTTDPNYDQTHKTLTVKVVDELPGGADDTQDTQSFDFTRTVTDDGAGNLSYGDWTTTGATSYTDVTAAAIDGLTASPDKVTSTTAADDGTVIGDALTAFGAATSDDEPDQTLTVTIKYTAATGSATVTYVDDDKGGATVTSADVDGALGKTTDYKVVVPDGYELAAGQAYKDGETTPILITADTSDNATIHLVHKIDHNPTNVDSDMLNKTFTITVTAQSPDGSDVTPTGGATTQQIHFTRTASEDEVTGDVTYTAWTETEDPDADYTEVDAKAVADYTTFVNGQAGDKVTEADSATDVAAFQKADSNKDGSDTFAITYKQTTFNVEHPGTTDDTQVDQLQKVVTETVNYGSPRSGSKVVETVTYYRTATVTYTTDDKGNTTQGPATYSAWSTDKAGTTATSGADVTGSFDALTDAELDTPTGYTAKVTNADGDDVTADSTADYSFKDDADNGAVNVTLNVDYDKDKGTIYTPGNNPDNLDLTKTVNVTVNYGDPVNESNDSTDGSPAAIKFYRTATTDPTKDKTDEGYYTYGDWTTDPDGDATKGTADVTVDGKSYVDQSKTPSAYAIKTVTTTVDGLTGTKVTADNNSVLVNVTYAKVVNTPNDPGTTPETNKDALTKTVKEVVNYGAPVGGTDTITTVNYYRTVTVGTDANGDPTYTYSAWTTDANVNADTDAATTGAAVNGSFDALTDAQLKTPRGYSAQVTTTGDTTTTDGSAAPYTFADDANNDPVTVTRNVSYTLQPGTTSTPTNNPDNLDLTKTVTVTVNYGDPVNTTDDTQKSINFYRTATTAPTKDPADADYYTYTAWTTDPDGDTTKGAASVTVDGHSYVDGSKTPTNYTETDQTLVDGAAGTTVTADNSTVTVNVSYTKTTDTPKDPGTTPETDRDALTKTVTEVVNYGAPVGGTATITTVNYYRTVTVGADNNGNPTYAYSAWTTDENVNADTDTAPTGAAVNGSFAALTTDQLKTPAGYTATVTTTGATTTTDGSAAPYTFKDNTDNSALTVTRNVAYTTTVGPDNPGTEPGTTLDDLTKTVTENVVYGTPVSEQDNAVVSYTFYRTATVDGEGKVVAYGAWTTDQSGTSKDAADQSVTVDALTDLKVPSASYTATVTTDVDGKTTADNTAVTVPGGASTDDQDVTITRTVNYTGHFTPGNPGTDDQTNADALTKKVTETVTYNEPDGTVTTTDGPEQTFYRTANTDADGNVTYGAWTTDPDGDATKGTANVTVAKLADDDVARAGYTYIMKNAVDGAAQADGNVDLTIPGTENGDADVAVTRVVTYAAESQTITVSYIDDTTGKTLEEKSLTGDSATDSGYNVATVVADYEQKGYKVVSNDAPTGNLIFDQDDTQAQTYTVHLTHGTVPGGTDNPTPIKDGGDYTNDFERTITEHVGYVNADGTNAPGAVDHSITFTRTITVDQVTGKVVANGEFTTDWVADGGTDTFAAVTTPDEPGYVADKDSVPAATVTADSKNISVTVTYTPATDTPATT